MPNPGPMIDPQGYTLTHPDGYVIVAMDGDACCCGAGGGPGTCCEFWTRNRYCPDSPNGEVQVCCSCGEAYDFELDWRYFVTRGVLPGAWSTTFPCTNFGSLGVVPPPPDGFIWLIQFQATIRFSVRCVNGVRTVTQAGPALYKRIVREWRYRDWPQVPAGYVFHENTIRSDFQQVYDTLFGGSTSLLFAPCGLAFDSFTTQPIEEFGGIAPMPGQRVLGDAGGHPWSDCDGTGVHDEAIAELCGNFNGIQVTVHTAGTVSWGGMVGCAGGNVTFGGNQAVTVETSTTAPIDVGTNQLSGSAVWSVSNRTACAVDPCDDPTPVGACCLLNGLWWPFSCMILSAVDCAARGGVYRGDGSDCQSAGCPETGACCGSDGTCTQTTEFLCGVHAGTYLGDGTRCRSELCGAIGGCCIALSDGSGGFVCEVHSAAGCAARGGTYLGDGVGCAGDPCQPRGTCCIAGGRIDLGGGCWLNVTYDWCAAFGTRIGQAAAWDPFNRSCAELGCGMAQPIIFQGTLMVAGTLLVSGCASCGGQDVGI